MTNTLSTRILSGALVLVLVAAACGGSDRPDLTAERELEEFNESTTTEAPEPDPTVATTEAPETTTTTEVIETTTTAATTTTTLAPTQEEQKAEIIAAVEAYAESWRECLRQLPNCDTSALAGTRTSQQLSDTVALVDDWNSLGYRAEKVDQMVTRIDAVRFFDEASDVEVEVCETGGGILLEGDDVVDDEFVTAILYIQVLEQDGIWKVFRVTQERAASGIENDLCV